MTKEKVTITSADVGDLPEVVRAADVPAKPEPKSYDFTLAKNLTRDLRNYHESVKAQILEQPESVERGSIMVILGDMHDELEALEDYVGAESAKSELEQAQAALKAAQDKVAALKG